MAGEALPAARRGGRPAGWRARAGVSAAVVAGLAAGLVAWLAPLAGLVAFAGVAAAGAVAAALRWPGWLVAGLLGLVVAQDALVAAGLEGAQQADEVAILALVLVAAWGLARAGRPGRAAPWDAALIAFVAAALLGAAWNAVPPVIAALGILAVTKGALAGAAAARVPLTARGARRTADAAAAAVAVSGLVAVLQRLGGPPVFLATGQAAHLAVWEGAKAPGLFAHHNALAHASVLAGAWWLGRRAAGLPAGPAVRAAEAATLAGLIASASREGWLAALVGMAAVALLAAFGRLTATGGASWRPSLHTALAALAALLAMAAGATYGASPVLRAELARRLAGIPGGWRDFDLGLTDWAFRGEYRVYALRKSLEVWVDHPLLGTGAGRFGGAVAERFDSPVYEAYAFLPLDGRFLPLDLFWARLPAEFGLLGAAAFVWLAVAGARATASAARAEHATVRALAIGGGAAWAAACVLAAFAPSFEEPLVIVPLWLWTAAAWRLSAMGPPSGGAGDAAAGAAEPGGGESGAGIASAAGAS